MQCTFRSIATPLFQEAKFALNTFNSSISFWTEVYFVFINKGTTYKKKLESSKIMLVFKNLLTLKNLTLKNKFNIKYTPKVMGRPSLKYQ